MPAAKSRHHKAFSAEVETGSCRRRFQTAGRFRLIRVIERAAGRSGMKAVWPNPVK
jgi:hypothetical protein